MANCVHWLCLHVSHPPMGPLSPLPLSLPPSPPSLSLPPSLPTQIEIQNDVHSGNMPVEMTVKSEIDQCSRSSWFHSRKKLKCRMNGQNLIQTLCTCTCTVNLKLFSYYVQYMYTVSTHGTRIRYIGIICMQPYVVVPGRNGTLSVAYSNYVAVFKALQHSTSVKGGAH